MSAVASAMPSMKPTTTVDTPSAVTMNSGSSAWTSSARGVHQQADEPEHAHAARHAARRRRSSQTPGQSGPRRRAGTRRASPRAASMPDALRAWRLDSTGRRTSSPPQFGQCREARRVRTRRRTCTRTCRSSPARVGRQVAVAALAIGPSTGIASRQLTLVRTTPARSCAQSASLCRRPCPRRPIRPSRDRR